MKERKGKQNKITKTIQVLSMTWRPWSSSNTENSKFQNEYTASDLVSHSESCKMQRNCAEYKNIFLLYSFY
jgi:hypothetical protein